MLKFHLQRLSYNFFLFVCFSIINGEINILSKTPIANWKRHELQKETMKERHERERERVDS